MTKISIIINIDDGKNLKKTLNSLKNQTFKDFQVVCVGKKIVVKLLNEYGSVFEFLDLVIRSKNIPKLFNEAFRQAKGEYVCFINEGDVFKTNDSLEKLYGSSYDIVSFKSNSVNLNEYMFKTDFLKNNNIKFNDSESLDVFISKVLPNTEKLLNCDINFKSNPFNDSKNIDKYFKSYKLILDNLYDSDFKDMIYYFRDKALDYIDALSFDNLDEILKSLEDNLADYFFVLRNFKEYLYFKYSDNPKFNSKIKLEKNPLKPRISVLIPVYNASEYLNDSITSLLNQTLDDFEIICVNDGSKDNSLEILKDFSNIDSRVKVFDKENGGCGSARNRALDEASGEFIYFFDPDDLLEPNTFEEIYKSAVFNLSDMVIFKANIFDDNGIRDDEIFFKLYKNLKQKNYERFTFTYKDVDDFIVGGGFAPWAKLYKKEFLDLYDDFRFNVGLAFDDVPFHVKSMVRARRLAYVNKILYHYRVDNQNSVNSTSSNGFDIFKIIDIVGDFLIKEGVFDEFEKRFYIFQINHTLAYIISTNSDKYYNIARERFLKIEEQNVTKNREKYNMVINNENYEDFKKEYFDYELNRYQNDYKKLMDKNDKLKKENKSLRKLNKELFSSRSWKLTKPVRKITDSFKK